MIIAYMTQTIAPVLAFGIFLEIAKHRSNGGTLDVATAFTSLSLFSLLSTPVLSLLRSIPSLMSALGAFARIQEFLLASNRTDPRVIDPFSAEEGKFLVPDRRSFFTDGISGISDGRSGVSQDGSMELSQLLPWSWRHPGRDQVIAVQNGYFGWSDDTEPILRSIDLVCYRSNLTFIVGSVGCGKSTLLKGLLGEMPMMRGNIRLSSSSIAYCSQTPWLVNGTILDNIIGFSQYDKEWYDKVLYACALEKDIQQLPQGRHTMIGSRGITLSGGQKQRLVSVVSPYTSCYTLQ